MTKTIMVKFAPRIFLVYVLFVKSYLLKQNLQKVMSHVL